MNTRSARITRLRPERPPATRASDRAARNLGYRRLVTTILGLDVATLAAELCAARLGDGELARAA